MRRRTIFNYNQLTLPFGERGGKAISMSAHAGYDNRVRFFWILVAISILSLSVYIYAINATARNIAARQNLEKEVAKIATALNSLEFAYIGLKNDITIELAYSYGFREVKSPLYVSRARSPALSFNTLNR